MPADFLALIAMYPSVQRFGQQLRPEADAEDGHVLIQRAAYYVNFLPEVRVVLDIVRVHRAAQHDQGSITIETNLSERISTKVNVAYAKA